MLFRSLRHPFLRLGRKPAENCIIDVSDDNDKYTWRVTLVVDMPDHKWEWHASVSLSRGDLGLISPKKWTDIGKKTAKTLCEQVLEGVGEPSTLMSTKHDDALHMWSALTRREVWIMDLLT